METRILIWLVDYGFYFRPLEKTICVPLAYEFKKIPSDVFEAGIHGVIPIDKVSPRILSCVWVSKKIIITYSTNEDYLSWVF